MGQNGSNGSGSAKASATAAAQPKGSGVWSQSESGATSRIFHRVARDRRLLGHLALAAFLLQALPWVCASEVCAGALLLNISRPACFASHINPKRTSLGTRELFSFLLFIVYQLVLPRTTPVYFNMVWEVESATMFLPPQK